VENRARRECKLWNANRRRCRHTPYAGAVNTGREGQGREGGLILFHRASANPELPRCVAPNGLISEGSRNSLGCSIKYPIPSQAPSPPPLPFPRARRSRPVDEGFTVILSVHSHARVCRFREFENFVATKSANSLESCRATFASLSDNVHKTERNKRNNWWSCDEHVTVQSAARQREFHAVFEFLLINDVTTSA